MNNELKLQMLIKSLRGTPKVNNSWLPKDPNRAFLVCLGAGPWGPSRREQVQKDALEWFDNRYKDLLNATAKEGEKIYPLDWQNKFLHNAIEHIKARQTSFGLVVEEWQSLWNRHKLWKSPAKLCFRMCGANEKGAKVLWLFLRDYVETPAFPIDRWVARALNAVDLPEDSWEMTKLCLSAGVDPNSLNRIIFASNSSNPDWSKK